uniref:Uncharacterized protein n=1 Tax=Leersia perrieri TaxID=77586 RepID=A0A0D9XY84_9ORYZ
MHADADGPSPTWDSQAAPQPTTPLSSPIALWILALSHRILNSASRRLYFQQPGRSPRHLKTTFSSILFLTSIIGDQIRPSRGATPTDQSLVVLASPIAYRSRTRNRSRMTTLANTEPRCHLRTMSMAVMAASRS